jgi:hypothetical protein
MEEDHTRNLAALYPHRTAGPIAHGISPPSTKLAPRSTEQRRTKQRRGYSGFSLRIPVIVVSQSG